MESKYNCKYGNNKRLVLHAYSFISFIYAQWFAQ